MGGVKPNPRLSKVYEGIQLARDFGAEFLLAVGGGSVIDTCKAIGAGLKYDGDVWDLYIGKAICQGSAPVGAVLTIAATGSEMSNGSLSPMTRICSSALSTATTASANLR